MRSSGSRAIRENRPNGLHVSKRPQDSRRLPCRCPGHSGFDARQAKGRGLPVSDRLGSTSATFGAAAYRAWARSYASIHIPARLPVRSGPTAAGCARARHQSDDGADSRRMPAPCPGPRWDSPIDLAAGYDILFSPERAKQIPTQIATAPRRRLPIGKRRCPLLTAITSLTM